MTTATDALQPRGWTRWWQVVLASALINTSYGTMSYSFAVLVTEGAIGGSMGKGTVSLAFSLALLVAGVSAVGIGTLTDLLGSRRVLGLGAVTGATGLALVALCQEGWQLLVIMPLVVGPGMAATFYEPVYVLMNRWFGADERPRAYGVLTLLSGVSITIYTPLTQALVDGLGWRGGVATLALILLVVGVTVALLLHEGAKPVDVPAARMGPRRFAKETADGVRETTPVFWVSSIAFFAGTVAFGGTQFHMISQLEVRGFDPGTVAAVIGVTGLVSLPGRLLLPSLASRVSSTFMLAFCLGCLALAAIVASVADEWWQVWVYVGVFGLVFGAVYPLRTLMLSEQFDGAFFGRVIGLQAMLISGARAFGPVAIGLPGTDAETYSWTFRVAAVVLAIAATVIVISGRRRTAPAASPAPE